VRHPQKRRLGRLLGRYWQKQIARAWRRSEPTSLITKIPSVIASLWIAPRPPPRSYVEGGHFRIGDLYSFGISVAIEFAADQKTFFVVVAAISGITT
jgi:hypothetical protein